MRREAKPGFIDDLLKSEDGSVRIAVLLVGAYNCTDTFEQEESLSKREAKPGLVGDLLKSEDASVRTVVLPVGAYLGINVLTTLNRKSLFRSAELGLESVSQATHSTMEMHL